MVLLSAQGMDAAAIAKVAFTSEDRVRDVIRNFNADGRLARCHRPSRPYSGSAWTCWSKVCCGFRRTDCRCGGGTPSACSSWGYGGNGLQPVLIGGLIIGVGVSSMHYLGMAAMSMRDTVRYNRA